ncbi:microtubule-associated protein futsch, partial [Nephila pilipes]
TEEKKDDQKLPSPKSESVTKVSDEEEAHVTEEVDETDGESTITRTITTVTRKIVVPSEDAEETTQEIKDDQKTSSSKSTSPAVTPHVDDAQVTEIIDESDGTSTITRTITTVTRKIVVPSEDAEETTQEIKDDQKASSLQSASPAMTPDVDDARVTEEIDDSDGTSKITKTVTTITRKIIVPSEDVQDETIFSKVDQKLSTSKIVSPSISPDMEDVQVSEEADDTDGTSTITKTVIITRKIVVPSEETDEVTTDAIIKDTRKSLSPKSESLSKTPDVDDVRIIEECDESEGTSTTKTITTVTRKIIIPSEDQGDLTKHIKEDRIASICKSDTVSRASDIDDAHTTEETNETDGTSTLTRTITTVTRKIVVPSDDMEDITQVVKGDQKAVSLKSESPSKTSDVVDVHTIEGTDELDGTSTITKTITTVTRKIVEPSDDDDISVKKDDKKPYIPKSESQTKTQDDLDVPVTDKVDETDETSTITQTVTTEIHKISTHEDGRVPEGSKTSLTCSKIDMETSEESAPLFSQDTIKESISDRLSEKLTPKESPIGLEKSVTITKSVSDKGDSVTTEAIRKESLDGIKTSEMSNDVISTTKTSVYEDSIYEKSIKSEKSSLSKFSEDREYIESKSESKTITKSDSSQQKIDIHLKEFQIKSSEAEKIDKKSEKVFEDSVTKSSVTTTTLLEEHETSSDSKISQSIKTTSEEIITGKGLTELSIEDDDEITKDLSHKIITTTSISEETAFEDFHSEKSSIDSTVKIMESSEIMTRSFDDASGTSSPRTRLSSEDDTTEDSPRKKKSKKKEPRTIRKKIIVYQTGADDSAESILTEDQIREAIIEAGGKRSSKSHIISYGTVDDLDSLSGKENVVELRSRTTTPQPEEECPTQKTEATREELESIEIDPFSLITKPIEETFRKKMLEQQSSVKTTEIKQVMTKESSRETIEEISIDTKVATDAKKLAMETLRSSRERTETTQSEVSETEEVTSSTSTTERSSTIESRISQRMSGPSQSDREEDTKSFNLDEWGKPMGLPSPPEPLDFETGLSSLSKQATTHTTKQESSYTENKTDGVTEQKNNMSDMKSETEKSNKETDSVSEKEYRHHSNKMSEDSTEPVYIDLTYVPHFGDPHYCNAEFFRRIRARYYVFSGTKPSKEVFNALLEAKQDWKDKEAKVTIIPTYETDTLGYWMAVNQEALIANNIDVAPSASRCTINLQDHETSCSAYRLEL